MIGFNCFHFPGMILRAFFSLSVTLRAYKKDGKDYNFFVIGGVQVDYEKALTH